MEELIFALLANPAFRTVVEDVAMKIFADVFHRVKSDPAFAAQFDAATAQLSAAKTPEDQIHAQNAIRLLMQSS